MSNPQRSIDDTLIAAMIHQGIISANSLAERRAEHIKDALEEEMATSPTRHWSLPSRVGQRH